MRAENNALNRLFTLLRILKRTYVFICLLAKILLTF